MKATFRHQLMASTLLFGMATAASPALAQDNTADGTPSQQVGDAATDICASNPNAAECLEQGTAIVVTGSRIASPTLTSPSPLQVLDAARHPGFGPAQRAERSAGKPGGFGRADLQPHQLRTS